MGTQEKLKELIVYIADRSSNDPRLGRTKMAKLLFLADFEAYAELGQPITGASYRKRPHGPMPSEELMASKDLEENGEITIEPVDYYGYTQKRIVAKRDPEPSAFSSEERVIVDRVIDRHWEDSATDLSDLSHEHPGWRFCAYDEVIPYTAVFWPREDPSERDIERAVTLIRELDGEPAYA